MKNENEILRLQNIITLLIFITIIPSIIAQQQNKSNYSMVKESNYYLTIDESSYYSPIQDYISSMQIK